MEDWSESEISFRGLKQRRSYALRMATNLPEKTCATCGRTFTWRKAWENNWDDVRYCSKACRRQKPDDTDAALEAAILRLLDARSRSSSICPSEAARAVDPEGWRDLMERARRAGRRLVAQGVVEITQQGKVVDSSRAKGPIRIRRSR